MSKNVIHIVGKTAVNLLKCSALLLGSTVLTEALSAASKQAAGDIARSVRSIQNQKAKTAA